MFYISNQKKTDRNIGKQRRPIVMLANQLCNNLIPILEGQIKEAAVEVTEKLAIKLTDIKKTIYEGAWCTYRDHNSKIEKQRG